MTGSEQPSASLRDLADEVRHWDPHAGSRLHDLAEGLDSKDRDPWAELDIATAIDVDSIIERAVSRDTKPHRTSAIERVRNVLVLLPILVTWAGLAWASHSYGAATTAVPELAEKPFLLLWERGFDGYGLGPPGFNLSLSLVAAVDVVIITVIAALTWIVHSQTSVAAAEHYARAVEIEDRLRDALWQASLDFKRRGSLPGAVASFESTAKALVAELKAERTRLQELVDSRERRGADLRNFAQDFGSAAAAMSTSAADMATKVAGSIAANAVLAKLLSDLATTESRVGVALDEISARLGVTSDASRSVAASVESAATSLSDAVETVPSASAKLADASEVLRREVAELRRALEADAEDRRRHEAEIVRTVATMGSSLTSAAQDQSSAIDRLVIELQALRSSDAGDGHRAKRP